MIKVADVHPMGALTRDKQPVATRREEKLVRVSVVSIVVEEGRGTVRNTLIGKPLPASVRPDGQHIIRAPPGPVLFDPDRAVPAPLNYRKGGCDHWGPLSRSL